MEELVKGTKLIIVNRSNIIRREVANNENTDSEVLRYLAYDCNDLVRLGVGNNPSSKKKTLLVLKNESAEAARRLLYC